MNPIVYPPGHHVENKISGRKGIVESYNLDTDRYIVKIDEHGSRGSWPSCNTKILVQHGCDPLTDRYSFNSLSKFDIDWKAIMADTSRKEPMAIITIGDERYVVMHVSLKLKAQVCGIPLPNTQHKLNLDVFKITENFASWISFAKEVRAASWPKDHHRKARVEVIKVKV